ncbi:hypothetical protein H7F10_04445 [Acidithiobacillus sp. HP-6]|uniref:hypothetical protein n=1 Tax=unclassified Acidithiobacillus TaxID=2614800 RepID=UPI001878FEA8|nr:MULTISPECIES: hypothetical protein [unclassified Acidithiobacillus]MBE7562220.1 hypothetical protein [Acidithiobacillus sp. HP-6]MBE7568945.1 hypothetical protein [Acidithiobacillus sp. HP-2]
MGQFAFFPDGGRLLILLENNASPPSNPMETWAVQMYQETFSPDCGYRWVQKAIAPVAWASWVFLLAISVFFSVFIVGLLPKGPVVMWSVAGITSLWALSVLILLFLLITEMILLWRKGIPLNFRKRKAQWLANNPAPSSQISSDERLPWWFWVDTGVFTTLLRVAVFLGGFFVSLAVVFYVLHVTNPVMITPNRFWLVVYLWGMTVFWFALSLPTWLSHIDWTHRNREILILWAKRR